MSDPLLVLIFLFAGVVSLASSWLLVSRLERLGARLRLSEALLGLVAALAADAPEITAAATALGGHHARIGAGVAIGSNVFNLAALLGLSSIVAGRINLHRRVIVLQGLVAVALAALTVAVVAGALPAAGGLGLVVVIFVPYIVVLAAPRGLGAWRLPARWVAWLSQAVHEEEAELAEAIHPRPGHRADAAAAIAALATVIGASVLMEHAASDFGTRHGIPQILTGALVLAAVTSLPNAVAAIYLALRGRGAAALSTTLNSNALNIVIGLMLSGTLLGLGSPSSQSELVALWSLGLTVFTLTAAYRTRGLIRPQGIAIVGTYVVFVGVLVATAS